MMALHMTVLTITTNNDVAAGAHLSGFTRAWPGVLRPSRRPGVVQRAEEAMISVT
jgi:hypothetical protein